MKIYLLTTKDIEKGLSEFYYKVWGVNQAYSKIQKFGEIHGPKDLALIELAGRFFGIEIIIVCCCDDEAFRVIMVTQGYKIESA